MDPQACFKMMLDNEHGEIELYNDCKSSLIAWLASGGFGPYVVYAPPANFNPTLGKGAHGRRGKLVALTYTGEATVRWGNGRQSIVRLCELGYES